MGAYLLNLVAGALTTLSPCVLPVPPIIVGSTARGNRYVPLAMAGGMIAAFTALGLVFASAGSLLGLSQEGLRKGAALLLIAAGLALAVPKVQDWMQRIFTPLANAGSSAMQHAPQSGLWGGLFVGLLLGAVWSPCAGPTLGAAVGLATQGSLASAAGMMFLFGVGAALPLLLVAYASKGLFGRLRGKLLSIGSRGKIVFGLLVALIGLGILTGADKAPETALVERLPEGWVDLITRY